jgi:hypothetical protein
MTGRRSMLTKILKGSRAKRVIELGLNHNPVYGFYTDLPLDDVRSRIDWVILNGYLEIEYDYRLPMLVYTEKGWEIEKETYADELLAGFDKLLESGDAHFDMTYLKDRNRGMILMLLDKVEATGDEKYIPILMAWEKVDYQKVQKRIRNVIRSIRGGVS